MTATDNAGHNVTDDSTDELTVDTVEPTVTVASLATNNPQPVLNGTVSDPSPTSGLVGVTVVVGGQTLAATVTGGTWSVSVPVPLSDGVYDVYATASDHAGNGGSDFTSHELSVFTWTVTVATLVTSNNRPTLTGTVIVPSVGLAGIEVTVGGQTIGATITGSNWNATVPARLADGIYDVQIAATDNAGNLVNDTTIDELTVDATSPIVTVTELSTPNRKPLLSGTVSDPAPSSGLDGVTVVVGGQTLTATVNGGTWSVAVPIPLDEGTYDVQATAADVVGNNGSDTTTGELTIEPSPVTVTVATLTTNDNRPTLTGTVDVVGGSVAGVSVEVAGQTITAAISGGQWTATVPVALTDGVYDVQAMATDLDGNSNNDLTTDELTVDTMKPTVTVTALTTSNNRPELSGTVGDDAPSSGIAAVTVMVGGRTLTCTVDGNLWTVTVPEALADGTHDVQVTATDNAGNLAGDPTIDELVVDTTDPVVTVASLNTTNRKPTLSGTVSDPSPGSGLAGVTVMVDGQTLTANVSNGIWSVVVPAALAEGTYDVLATATDLVGNFGTDMTSDELTVEPSPVTVTVSTLATNNNRPTLIGTVDVVGGTVAGVIVAVAGQTLAADVNGSEWSVVVPTALADGIYDVWATATDLEGNNNSDLTIDELTVDTIAPTVTVTTLTTSNNRPELSGTVGDSAPSSGIAGVTVVVGGQTLTATVSGGTWRVTVPVALVDGVYDVAATVVDRAGNSGSDVTTDELIVNTNVLMLAPIPDQTIDEQQSLTVTAQASDPHTPFGQLHFSLDTAPTGATIHPQLGIFTWTPDQPQVAQVTVRVTNPAAEFDTQSFTVTVQQVLQVTLSLDQNPANIGGSVQVTVSATSAAAITSRSLIVGGDPVSHLR